MIRNHYGVRYDDEQPVTGVIQNNGRACQALYEESLNALNLSYEEALKEHVAECRDDECIDSEHDEWKEGYESQEDTYLLGGWRQTQDHEWEPDKNAEEGFAAIMGAYNTQIVWSKYVTKVRAMCSPCYPGQADLDSGKGEILAYTLPEDWFEKEEEKLDEERR